MPYVIYREVNDGYDYYRHPVETFQAKDDADEYSYYEGQYLDESERYVVVYENNGWTTRYRNSSI